MAKGKDKAASSPQLPAALLVELLTEELPPKALAALGQAFADGILGGLVQSQLAEKDSPGRRIFATPRRLATLVPAVLPSAGDREVEVLGPPVKAPPEAVAGFARKNGVEVARLEQKETPKGLVYAARMTVKGAVLGEVLAGIVAEALRKLPVPKLMRWGSGEAQFARPVHGLVMIHGKTVVQGEVLGVASGSATRGHRFLSKGEVEVAEASGYEAALRKGHVVADFAARRAEIDAQLQAAARRESAALGSYEDLLDEVAALVEWPVVYAGAFDASFLEVPQECLILTMRQNQKYFPLFDAAGKLLPRFLIVSNMATKDPRHIVGGNERVVRPRLEDARFFYRQDQKARLESRVPQLARVVYHRKLGSQTERVQRIQLLAGSIARQLGADPAAAERAAWLSKADLLTGMVGEFPELQGIMGRYYATKDGEPADVADAIESHYRPRFAGDALPQGAAACAVALGDKLDTVVGLFGVGEQPTGEKDPFGLRRHALGVLRILMERRLPLSLQQLLSEAAAGYRDLKVLMTHVDDVRPFIMERLRNLLREQGYDAREIDAVVSQSPDRIDLVLPRLEAVRAFAALPEAESLAAANKRIGNILRQAGSAAQAFDAKLLKLPEELSLLGAYELTRASFEDAYGRLEYTVALKTLATLKSPVDAFFEKVMVMDEDPQVRANRIGFLGTLHGTMNRIADLSKLAK